MVTQDSPANPSSSNLHEFLITNQTQLENQKFNAYPPYLGEFSSIHSLSPPMQDGHYRHFTNLLESSNETNHQTQRLLSLSLGSQKSLTPNLSCPQSYLNSSQENPFDFYGAEFFTIGSSKYLKPTQSLLEEAANGGGREFDLINEKYVRRLSTAHKNGSLGLGSDLKADLFNNGLLSGEKHELQAKLAKLTALLEEVEIRFEQYYNHLEQLVSSFEVMVGVGAGKSYTTLALHAMSKHFCSLRESIISQIYATRRKIQQEMPRINAGLSQLSLFDQENRHSRASLQQLGIIRSTKQAWRPIRGLPETSVSILRSWLFEHFLNPYPNDIEKLTLASQTGLSKNQVSNWFINARVRLWKPMIEEMYKEEFAESEDDSVNPLSARSSVTKEGIIIADHEED